MTKVMAIAVGEFVIEKSVAYLHKAMRMTLSHNDPYRFE